MSVQADIVFFMMDQLSMKWLEACESGAANLPNFVRLKNKGITFTRAYTSNPICAPARATLATGLSSSSHGVIQNGYILDPELPNVMNILQGGGWRTGAFGKLHFKPYHMGLREDFHCYGFDVTDVSEDPRGGLWLDWIIKEHPEHLDGVLATLGHSLYLGEYKSYGEGRLDLESKARKVLEGFKWGTEKNPDNCPQSYTYPFPENVSQTNWITDRAIDFIRDTPANRSLFAHISYVKPHLPISAPEEYMELVNVEKLPDAVSAEWLDDPLKPSHFSPDDICYCDYPKERVRRIRHYYFADLIHLDRQLGRIVDVLEETGRMKRTYVVYLADHGELLMDHGYMQKFEKHYDACVRVPLVITGPGLSENMEVKELVQLEDILPTVLDLVGRTYPVFKNIGRTYVDGSAYRRLPGDSLVPFCRGERPSGWRKDVFIESYNPGIDKSLSPRRWGRTIIDGRFRYTAFPDSSGEQLFDLMNDPDETLNLAGSDEHREVRMQMRETLLNRLMLQNYPHSPRGLYGIGGA